MTDRLTQLQECLDQLLIQMFASIRYIDTHHAPMIIPGQVDQFAPLPSDSQAPTLTPNTSVTLGGTTAIEGASQTQTQSQSQAQTQQAVPADLQSEAMRQQREEPISSMNPHPDAPDVFEQRMLELAQDLVLKEQQIEALIASLPGIGNSQAAQEERLRQLNKEMRRVETEREVWRGEWERLRGVVNGWIGEGVRRV